MDIKEQFEQEFTRLVYNLKAINERWITIHPHGEDSEDYRRLKLEDGETPKEAIERVYKKGDKQEKGKEEDLNQKIKELKEKANRVGGEESVLGRKYLEQAKELEKQQREKENNV